MSYIIMDGTTRNRAKMDANKHNLRETINIPDDSADLSNISCGNSSSGIKVNAQEMIGATPCFFEQEDNWEVFTSNARKQLPESNWDRQESNILEPDKMLAGFTDSSIAYTQMNHGTSSSHVVLELRDRDPQGIEHNSQNNKHTVVEDSIPEEDEYLRKRESDLMQETLLKQTSIPETELAQTESKMTLFVPGSRDGTYLNHDLKSGTSLNENENDRMLFVPGCKEGINSNNNPRSGTSSANNDYNLPGRLDSAASNDWHLNNCNRNGTSVAESEDHYATLRSNIGALRRNTHENQLSANHRAFTKTSTRYIRQHDAFPATSGIGNFIPKQDANLVPENMQTIVHTKKTLSNYLKRRYFIIFGFGLVCGFLLSTLVWLFVDKLNENKVVCEINNRLADQIIVPATVTAKTTSMIFQTPSSVEYSTSSTASNTNTPLESSVITDQESTSYRDISSTPQYTNEFTGVTPTKGTSTITSALSTEMTSTMGETSSTQNSSQINSTEYLTTFMTSITSGSNSTDLVNHTSTPNTPAPSWNTSITSTTTVTVYTTETNSNGNTSNTSTMPPATSSTDNNTSRNTTTYIPTSSTTSSLTQSPVLAKRSVTGGYVYIRWGKTTCPQYAEQLYKGYAAGGNWQHPGGATKTICLPEVPSWSNYSDVLDEDRNLIYGTEYGSTDGSFSNLMGGNLRNKDMPCSACQATGRLSHIMVPGMTDCFPGWILEYKGYLMGSGYIHNRGSELICVDSAADFVTGSEAAKGGNFLYFAEVRTGALPSPPYVNGRELPCVMCTV